MILATPRTTEKAYALSSSSNVYVFNVPLDSTKQAIAKAVESQYDVKVTQVKTMIQTGKTLKYSRGKNRFPGTTNRKNTKKAYVTLAADNSIKVFDTETNQEAK